MSRPVWCSTLAIAAAGHPQYTSQLGISMNRRAFSQQVGCGLAAVFTSARPVRAATSRTEKKQWAHEHLKGMENALMPSFSADFRELDEEGIRHDVRQSIKHGFCSSTVTAVGTTAEQRTR